MEALHKYVENVQSGKADQAQIWVAIPGAGLLVGKVLIPKSDNAELKNTDKDFWLEEAFAVMPGLHALTLAQVSYAHIAAWGLAEVLMKSIELAEDNQAVLLRSLSKS